MPDSPNVLLVTVDSLRADTVYGSQAATPAYRRLGEHGVTYERAFAQGPFTTFSMPSLFTSRYPSGLGYMEFSDKTVGVYIDEEPTLPEVLGQHGYHTAGFHSNPLLSNMFGFDRGFDIFDARLPFSNTDVLPGRAKILADKVFRILRKHAYLPAETLNERAIDWLDGREESDPFFLWLHYMDVHGPYQSKTGNTYLNKYRGERLWRKAQNGTLSDEERREIRELYREEVEYTDEQLGVLLDALNDRGLLEDTLVVLTADHGEGFGEHGTYSHPHRLYDELIHVPLLVRRPDATTSQTVSTPVELVDVFPTLCARAGVDAPPSLAGEPLPAAPAGEEAAVTEERDESTVFSEADLTPAYNACVRTDRWKYIRDGPRDDRLLFDLDADPAEQTNVCASHPEVADRLATRLDTHLESGQRAAGPDRDVTRQEITDEGVQDRLQDLGYLE
jgi:arylsulfatase